MTKKPEGFILYQYAKDKTGKRIGCFAALVDPTTQELRAGWSKLHKLDYNKSFDRQKSKMIAEQRALKQSKVVIPNKLLKQYMWFILNAEYEFMDTVKHPNFAGKSEFEKLRGKWEERQKQWQEKAAKKDQEVSHTNSGVTTTV